MRKELHDNKNSSLVEHSLKDPKIFVDLSNDKANQKR